MEIKRQKKQGVALVLILIIVSSLTLTVMASIKVMTKSHTKYTTGKGYGKAINTNRASGKFICYKDVNGTLKQITIEYSSDGSITKDEDYQRPVGSNCVFKIQNSAESYKITLIGGGGGGAVPKAVQQFNKTIPTDGENTIIVGENQTKFKKLFTSYTKYIDQDTAFDSVYNKFFGNMSVSLKAPDAVIKSNVKGGVGATCIKNIIGESNSIASSANELVNNVLYYDQEAGSKFEYAVSANNNAYFKLGNKRVTAYGGLSAIYNNYNKLFSPSECTSDEYNSKACRTLRSNYGTMYSKKGVGKCKYFDGNEYYYFENEPISNEISYATSILPPKFNFLIYYKPENNNDRPYEIEQNSSINFSLKENTVDIYEATAGEPGAKAEFETKYLTAGNEKELYISGSSIGAGGKGGTASSNNGKPGSATRVTLNTKAGQNTIVANGGQGGTLKLLTTLEGNLNVSTKNNIGFQQNFIGNNGNMANYIISGDFGIQNVTPGVAQTSTSAKIEKASLPGSSGASGTLAWEGIERDSINPWIVYNSSHGDVVLTDRNVYPSAGNHYSTSALAGDGAYGAIIIEW